MGSSPAERASVRDDPVEPRSVARAGVDLEAILARLETEQARLREELAQGIEAPGQMTYGSQAAAASQVFAQQRDIALHDRAQRQLDLVQAALARLDRGGYGACQRCGRPIDPARLEAIPWAAFCIDCQRTEGRRGSA